MRRTVIGAVVALLLAVLVLVAWANGYRITRVATAPAPTTTLPTAASLATTTTTLIFGVSDSELARVILEPDEPDPAMLQIADRLHHSSYELTRSAESMEGSCFAMGISDQHRNRVIDPWFRAEGQLHDLVAHATGPLASARIAGFADELAGWATALAVESTGIWIAGSAMAAGSPEVDNLCTSLATSTRTTAAEFAAFAEKFERRARGGF